MVPHLLEDRHPIRRLQDLGIAVVPGPHVGHSPVEAAVTQIAVLRTVGAPRAPRAAPLPGTRLRRLGLRRSTPSRWVDDERRPVIERSLDQPERVVVAGDDVEVLELRVAERLLDETVAQEVPGLFGVAELLDCLGQLGQLFVRQAGLVAVLLGPLHRGGSVIGPDPLQVRMTRRGPWQDPAVRRGRLARHNFRSCHQRNGGDQHQHQREVSPSHLLLLCRVPATSVARGRRHATTPVVQVVRIRQRTLHLDHLIVIVSFSSNVPTSV